MMYLFKKRLKFNKFIFFISVIFYRIFLDINYVFVVSEFWEYDGFTNDFSLDRFALSLVILFVFTGYLCISLKFTKAFLSDVIILVIFLMNMVPGTSLMTFVQYPAKMLILWILYFVILLMFNCKIPHFSIKLPKASIQRLIMYLLVAYFSAVIIFIWARYANFRVFFNLFAVYEYRSEARDYNLLAFLRYSFSIAKIVLPSMMIYMLYMKKRILSCWLILLILMTFWIDGSKSVFFTLLISFAGYFLYSDKLNKFFAWLLGLATIFATLEQLFMNTFLISGFFVRRVLYVPNLLNLHYYDFFSNNEFDYFRAGILRRLGFISPYNELGVPHTLGSYLGKPQMGANNGLFSDAYSNLGLLGMIVMPLLVVLMLRLLECVCKNINAKLLIAVMVSVTMTFISSSFFTVMLTHGFATICIVFYFMPRDSQKKKITEFIYSLGKA